MNKILIVLCLIYLFSCFCNEKFKNFENFENDNIEVRLYYAPWCGHCKNFKPKWKKIKNSELKNKVTFVEINGDDNLDMCRERKVDAFPTLRVSKNEKEHDYDGDFSVKGVKVFIENFLQEQ